MKSRRIPTIGKLAVAILLAATFLFLAWTTARAGLSSLLSNYASKSYELEAANAAVTLSSNSPVAHYARGTILEARNDLPGAEVEYRQAVIARPDDCIYG